MAQHHYYAVEKQSYQTPKGHNDTEPIYRPRLTSEAINKAIARFYDLLARINWPVDPEWLDVDYRPHPTKPGVEQARVVGESAGHALEDYYLDEDEGWFDVNEVPDHPLLQGFNLWDEDDRAVLSDWMEENGRDEEADLLRRLQPLDLDNEHHPAVRWENDRIVPNV